ncbi:MAG: hypothetical protein KKC20_01835 [Proteobacteria bacterium]|nr:hypothetical protein [Pseudomonadota bacterium]
MDDIFEIITRKHDCAEYADCLSLAAYSNRDFQCTGCPKYQQMPHNYEPRNNGYDATIYIIGGGIQIPEIESVSA